MIIKLLQGLLIGAAFVLPGLSAGTVILIMGFYRRFVNDLSRLHIRPYLPLALGGLLGGMGAVAGIGYLMENYRDPLMAFLLGMLIASVPVVLKHAGRLKFNLSSLAIAALGFAITWFSLEQPSKTFTLLPPGSLAGLFVGGAVASAAMLLPGISGSALLVLMNMYEEVILAFTRWQWLKLAVFGAGAVVGLLGLSRVLSLIYRRYGRALSFFLSGLILGSIKALLPMGLNAVIIFSALGGALLVLLPAFWRK